MRPKRSRALLGTTIAAALAATAVAGPAQANTTLPGLNGKIAFTTNADSTSLISLGAAQRGFTEQDCFSPVNIFSIIVQGGDMLSCAAEINTINPDGTGQTAVTNDSVADDAPAWSPQDGSRIAFQSSRGENCGTSSSILDCNYDIWSTTSGGTDAKQLTSGPLNELHPSYSPDGSKIAFDGLNPFLASTVPAPGIATRDIVDPTLSQLDHLAQSIYTMPADGESAGSATPLLPSSETDPNPNVEQIVSDSQAAWSPDGSQIAFTRLTLSGPALETDANTKLSAIPALTLSTGIYVAPASGGPSHEVGTPQECDIPGNEVPFILQTVKAGEAGSVARTARAVVQAQDCVLDVAPAWSPDGLKIAFERITLTDTEPTAGGASSRELQFFNPFEDSDIMVMNASDGSGVVDLSKVTEPADCASFDTMDSGFTCGQDQKPAWSPDGTKIAFFSNRGANGLYTGEECFDVDSSEMPPTCDDEIWVMNADGSNPTQLTNNTVNDVNPDWQRIPPPPAPPATLPVAPASKPRIGVAGVRRACVSRSFHVRFHVATSSSVKSIVVKLDGKRIKSTKRSSFTLTINGKKLKAGRHRLTITATDGAGHVTTSRKTFSVCKAAKPRRKAAPRFTG